MTIDDLFTVTALTNAINKLTPIPGRVGAMGLFQETGVPTTSVFIEYREGRLVLVPNQSRTEDGKNLSAGKRNGITLAACHLPLTAQILPSDIQNLREFGQEGNDTGLAAQARVINDRLQDLKNSIEATREYHRVGATRGKVLDSDGQTVLVDLYEAFGVQQKKANVALSNANTNVRKACLDAKRYGEKKLGGVVVTGWRSLCGSDFFDALVDHPKVQKAYEGYQEAQDRIGGDMRSGFTYGGIEFIEAPEAVGNIQFIPANVAQVFPVAQGVFKTFNAPANYNEAVNTIGQPYYAKSEPRKMGKGWDIEAQSNPLTICMYPEALIELTAT